MWLFYGQQVLMAGFSLGKPCPKLIASQARLFQIGVDDIREHSTIIECASLLLYEKMRGPSSIQVSAYLPDQKLAKCQHYVLKDLLYISLKITSA